MKRGYFYLFISFGLLCIAQVTVVAGEASGGGTPEVILAQCENSVMLSAPAGQEITRISATANDKNLTVEPLVFKDLGFSFVGPQVHFFVKTRGTPKDAFYLQMDTEPTDGVFLGTLSISRKSKSIRCTRLNERFRPMPDRQVNLEFFHGGKNCAAGGQCVGYISGLLPEKHSIALSFNVKNGQLEGKWRIEKEVFDFNAVFELMLTQRRNQPLKQQFTLSLKDEPNPTICILEGQETKVELHTPAFRLGNHTLSIWQKAKVSIVSQ